MKGHMLKKGKEDQNLSRHAVSIAYGQYCVGWVHYLGYAALPPNVTWKKETSDVKNVLYAGKYKLLSTVAEEILQYR
jgi:hypothetical protein